MTLSYPSVISTPEAQAIVARLYTAIQAIHQSPALPQNRLQATLTQSEYHTLTTITAPQPPSPHELTQILTATIAELAARPVLELQIAFQPSHTFLTNAHAWLEQYGPISCQVLWQVNPETVGGLLIGWQGKRYDYSLATKFDTYEQFPKIS